MHCYKIRKYKMPRTWICSSVPVACADQNVSGGFEPQKSDSCRNWQYLAHSGFSKAPCRII